MAILCCVAKKAASAAQAESSVSGTDGETFGAESAQVI